MQDKAAFQTHLLDHMANFDIQSPLAPTILTSIVATIGPSCMSEDILMEMMDEGMNVARVDMRMGTTSDQQEIVDVVRSAMMNYSTMKHRVYPLALAIDLKGPEILTGGLKTHKVFLERGEVVTLTAHPRWETCGDASKIFIDYKLLPFVVQPKNRILLDCGRIELSVRGTVDNDIVCEIISEGELGSYKDVCLPGIALEIDPVSQKDKQDIKFAIDNFVDALFVSAVRSKSAVQEIRDQLGTHNLKGQAIMVLSKIDSQIAFDYFDEILSASDGIIVNRGMMSIEMSTEKVMQAQKAMFAKCNKAGKPVFVMTEFLNSMVHKPCPTIAEVTDVATTVIDGADAIILNEETAFGDRPALTVKTLAKLCREAESEVWAYELFNSLSMTAKPPLDPAHAISIAAVEASLKAHAAALIVVTTSGRSAQMIARYRPRCPILAVTRYGAVARQLNLWRGVVPVHFISSPLSCWAKDVDVRIQYAIEFGKIKDIIKPGDPLVLVNGWRQGSGFTNNIRLVYAALTDPWVCPGPGNSPRERDELL
ncbi:hypothetical protein AAG570_010207 [Ranatra chinensis]|uniref:Pyruvate kinase n=1 Tax=Ranatra chinensis TaxID=642074 RepID=A0ABD0YM32_9HEMI